MSTWLKAAREAAKRFALVAQGREHVADYRAAESLARVSADLRRYERARDELREARELERECNGGEDGDELRHMAHEEAARLEQRMRELQGAIEHELAATTPTTSSSSAAAVTASGTSADRVGKPHAANKAFLEVLPLAGGKEASIFARELFDMYSRYAARRKWHFVALDDHVARISGDAVYERMRHEAGTVRVQRVPSTESAGRIHTSLASVVVLPSSSSSSSSAHHAAGSNDEHNGDDNELRDADIRMDTFRASGAGGQHVNTTDSAVRLTHLPTGVSVAVQSTRSQHQNRALARELLRARIRAAQAKRREAEQASMKRSQVGSGARHERVRTFNFQRDELVDHRNGRSVKNLAKMMQSGDGLDALVAVGCDDA